jgi:hypothetical protein
VYGNKCSVGEPVPEPWLEKLHVQETAGSTPPLVTSPNTDGLLAQVLDEEKSGDTGTGTFTLFAVWLMHPLLPVTVNNAL